MPSYVSTEMFTLNKFAVWMKKVGTRDCKKCVSLSVFTFHNDLEWHVLMTWPRRTEELIQLNGCRSTAPLPVTGVCLRSKWTGLMH